MHAKIITFAASAFIALGNAVPLNNGKRDVVWVTEVETAVETVGVTTTVWVDPTGAPSAPKANNRHGHGHRSKHQKQEQETTAVEVKPTPSPEPSSSSEEASSSQAAPEPASYEAPAAPSVEPTTSAAPAPATSAQPETTTSTPEPAPATTEAPVAPSSSYEAPASSYETPASSSAAAPSIDLSNKGSSSSGSSSSGNPASGQSFTGELTYFTPGMGACGEMSGEGDKMVAVSEALFDQYTTGGNPNKNPLCGKTLTIKGADGSDHKATIWDRCPGCAEADLDLPQEFFNEVTTPKDGSPADGRAHGVEWSMD